MKQLYILGNWKSNKTLADAQTWLQTFQDTPINLPPSVTLIVCPAFHHISLFIEAKFSFALGVQDLSPFGSGAYTGAIAASMVQGVATYAMLGHSERRKHFGETNEIVADKVKQALSFKIRPVVCVSEVSQALALRNLVPDFMKSGLILYEPLTAIGSGQADSPENTNTTAHELITILPSVPILYGGSVVPQNVKGFVTQECISGVGVGGASLDPQKFRDLIAAVL